MTDQERATQNISACHEALKAFEPLAPPQLWKELNEAVDRHEAAVRKANGLDEGIKLTREVMYGIVANAKNKRMDKPIERAPLHDTSTYEGLMAACAVEPKEEGLFRGVDIGIIELEVREHPMPGLSAARMVRNFYEAKITSGELRDLSKRVMIIHPDCAHPEMPYACPTCSRQFPNAWPIPIIPEQCECGTLLDYPWREKTAK